MKSLHTDTSRQALRAMVFVLCMGSLAVAHAQQQCPSNPGRFSPMTNNTEILDRYTGLIWKRCSEGQNWSGTTCTGTATTHTHEQALILAGQAFGGWRLPNARELLALWDTNCQSPAIDHQAFPSTPQQWFWTTTPSSNSNPWAVNFSGGNFGIQNRASAFPVRFVRSAP